MRGIAAYRLTFRIGPKVEHDEHDSLDAALGALEARLQAVEPTRETRSFLGREFDPVQQVAARAELKGPKGLRAGIDLRGDGSAEAWTGRFAKRLIERRKGEDAYSALRRSCPS